MLDLLLSSFSTAERHTKGAPDSEMSMALVSFPRSWSDAALWVAPIVAAAALAACGGGGGASPGSTDVASSGADSINAALTLNDPSNPIQILSSEPSQVSGGNALVRVALPAGTAASAVKVLVAGSDMTSRFRESTPGALVGVVDGLPVGTSTIDVVPVSGGANVATVTVRNWPSALAPTGAVN
jgi:hypothetical protein